MGHLRLPSNKPAPTDGRDADERRRQSTRGSTRGSDYSSLWDRSSARTTGRQTPQQEGRHSSGASRDAPSAQAPGSTPSQCGGSQRAPRRPLEDIANDRSQGWKKDLDRAFKAYYRYNFASFQEDEWIKLRDKVFEHLLPCQDEWRGIKENDPLRYMPYMEKHFHAATGIRLKGLSDFMGWIKCGSYYHAVVAKRGQLHKCAHLVEVELPKWPQMTPSGSRKVSHRREETPRMSPHEQSKKPSAAQGAQSDIPAAMGTGGTGDGLSWVDRAEASADDDVRGDRPAKRRRSELKRCGSWPTLPFLPQDHVGRCASAWQLYKHVGEESQAHLDVASRAITHQYPDLKPREAKSLATQVLCMIAEYHLTGLVQGSSTISPVLPEAAQELLPPIEDYLAGREFQGTRDVRVMERAKTLRIAAWLHHLDMATDGDETTSLSVEAARHGTWPLLELFLAPRTSSLTFGEVVQCVVAENRR